jgi:hypothetical protein
MIKKEIMAVKAKYIWIKKLNLLILYAYYVQLIKRRIVFATSPSNCVVTDECTLPLFKESNKLNKLNVILFDSINLLVSGKGKGKVKLSLYLTN